ncbi:SOS response-associated peptidase [Flavobacterium psychrotrophum]|uniref:SOS response-associated peptidase n=1 Tax=Flavobacterium psychrotrophum TaxID=2294119 RepID=UPI000E314152|nr:SOS response-associated peptidase [Flavobacterium psychrotrophum]
MCSRFVGVDWEAVVGFYRASAPGDLALLSEYDGQELFGYDHPDSFIITQLNPAVVMVAQWGLLPSWAKDNKLQNKSLNARVETLHEKVMFKQSMNNRCLVPATAFFEHQWTNLEKKNCAKIKHIIKVKDREMFCFAGLYSIWQGKATFTIVTTDANELMAEVHNTKLRMPIILKPEDEAAWLSGTPVENFALPYQVELVAEPILPEPEPGLLF